VLAAEAVEEGEKDNGDGRADERIDQEAQSEKRNVLVEQNALHDCEHGLMEMEKGEREDEAANGLLGVKPGANGGREIADERLCDAIKADRIIVAERVLKDADGRAEQQAGGGIAAADAEINHDEQGNVDEVADAPVFVKKRLQHQRKKTDEKHRAAIELVNFDVLFGAETGVEHRGHG
jgi:hypothetical protein